MPEDRRTLTLAASVGLLAVLVVFELVLGMRFVIAAAFALAPVVASAGASARATAVVAGLALALAALVVIDDDGQASGQDVVRLVIVAVGGVLAFVIARLRERTERAAASQGLMSEVSRSLAASANAYEGGLEDVARIVVPRAADWCAFHLLEDGDAVRRVATAHADPDRARRIEELGAGRPPRLGGAEGIARVLRTGDPEILPELDAAGPGRAAPDDEHVTALAALGVRSVILVPLGARGRVFGTLSLGRSPRRPRFDHEDLEVARDLGERCGRAVDNALLLAEARDVQRQLAESFALLDIIFERAPIGLAFFDREFRYVRVNDRLAEINGVPADEHLGRTIADVLPAMDADVAVDLRRVLETGTPLTEIEVVGETPASPGERREWSASYWPVRRGEEIIGLGAVVIEVTDARRAEAVRERLLVGEREAREAAQTAERRTAFLAEASAVFDQTLDEGAVLASVARLSVRDYADTCVILLAGHSRAHRPGAVAAADPERERGLHQLLAEFPLEERTDHPMLRVLRDGTPLVVPSVEDRDVEAVAQSERHLELMLAVAVRASIILPLRARGHVLGVLACGFTDLTAEQTPAMQALFEDLALRASLALDTARLYAERSHVARTLQRSLLPSELPRVPGVELVARYRAAGEGNEVGGDFYDGFATAQDEWAVVIGDVCGKGAEAAALTALARYTLRTSVLHDRRPVAVLAELNEAILRQQLDYRFCTVLYVALTRRDDGLVARVATGGHPLPLLLRADGRVETAGRPGTLLGVTPDPQLSEEEVELGPGDTLILYTDGVIEASPVDDAFGPARFAEHVAGCAGQGAGAIADAIERAVLDVQDGGLRDDVAILVVRVGDGHEASFAELGRGVRAAT